MNRAVFSYALVEHDIVSIVDQGLGKSVTNDIENVVRYLGQRLDLSKKALIYKDTLGHWDLILLKNGEFNGFRLLLCHDLQSAILKVRDLNQQIIAISGHVAQPNTPESDLLPEVMHVVHGVTGLGQKKTIKLMAACPLTAIDLARTMPASLWHDSND